MASEIRPDRGVGSERHSARERILAAAIEIFGAYGFTKATVQDIAVAAHVSKPLFYRNYKNKQDIFEAAVDRVFSDWRGALVERLASNSAGAVEALRLLFLEMLDYGRARPFLNRLLTRDSQLLLSTQSDVWDRACLALRRILEQILRAGIEAGEVRSDLPVEHMADLLTEIHFAYANRQIISGVTVTSEFAESLIASMVGGVSRERTRNHSGSRAERPILPPKAQP